jgi:hypothetical protein
MNKLKLIEYSKERVVYSYQPEGHGEPGRVCYTFDDQACSVLQLAEEAASYYTNKALSKLEELVAEKAWPKDFIQAWY